MHVEAVGIPAYPGQRLPRVIGLLRPRGPVAVPLQRRIEYVTGDATQPRGTGLRIITHVVNDRTANWGGGFARTLRDVHPAAQDGFRRWARESKANLSLGSVHFAHVEDDLVVATMVAQRGYGSSRGARLRYDALNTALRTVAAYAAEHQAVVHMPRIGAGMAGGDWRVIEELVATTLVAHDVEVIVYSLPGDDWRRPGRWEQQTL
jgi:O-acetyl-ADP-ribose deacetylase (regulator of RNase III)